MIRCVLPLLLAWSVEAAAAVAPKPFAASYAVFRGGKLAGTAELSLRLLEDGRWEFRTQTEADKGMASLVGVKRVERSYFTAQDGRIAARDYDYRQSIGWKKNRRSLHFGSDGSVIENSNEGDHRYQAPVGVLDGHVVVLAISLALADQAAPPVLEYRVARKGKVSDWQFRADAPETVDTALGFMRAIPVARSNDDSGRSTRSWHAASVGWLPVRIEHRDPKGESLRMEIRSYAPGG